MPVALVTGGASGIGRATVEVLARGGVSVWSVGLESGVEAGFDRHLQIDLTAPDAAVKVLDATGAIDILILNAGICRPAPLLATSRSDWDRSFDVNVTSTFLLLQETALRMKARGTGGSIVVTASTNSFDGEAGLIAYNASKAALLGIVHSAANELGPYNIRVNAVCPGFIRTPLTESSFQNSVFTRDYFRQVPLGRGGEPAEVAEAIGFLASAAASYITGTTLFVDGGQMASKFATWDPEGDHFDGLRWTRPTRS